MQAPSRSVKLKKYINPAVQCPPDLEAEKDALLLTLTSYVAKQYDKSTTINQLENLQLRISDKCVGINPPSASTTCSNC